MPLPQGITNERRESCIDHESRLDSMGAEVHTFKSYFQLIGGSIGLVFIVLGWFGSSINGKLNSIESLLSADKVAIAEIKRDLSALNDRVNNIDRRHEFADQNGSKKAR